MSRLLKARQKRQRRIDRNLNHPEGSFSAYPLGSTAEKAEAAHEGYQAMKIKRATATGSRAQVREGLISSLIARLFGLGRLS